MCWTETMDGSGVERLLRDPLIRLVMASDGVSDGELRSVLRRMELTVLRRVAGRQRIEGTAPAFQAGAGR